MAVGVGAACGGGGSGGGADTAADSGADAAGDVAGDAVGEVTEAPEALVRLADSWCPVLTARTCAAAAACGCSDVPGFDEAAPRDCETRVLAGCRAELLRFGPGVEAGVLAVAGELPGGCATALDEALAACVSPDETFFVRCPLVVPAGVSGFPGEGRACADELCAAGLRCSRDGLCMVPGDVGAACEVPGDCASILVCAEGKCAAPDLADRGKTCANPAGCGGEVQCLASSRRVCRAPKAGAGCNGDAECGAGNFCEANACKPAPGLDETCGNGVACAVGLACAFSGKGGPGPNPFEGLCRPIPKSGEGCALAEGGPFVCDTGLACVGGTCGPPPTDGQGCAVGVIRCADGLGCKVASPEAICAPRVGAGQPCQLDDTCEDGLFCDFNTNKCRAFYSPGAPCANGNECGPAGSCVPDDTLKFRCVAQPGEGDACFLDECEGGLSCESPYDSGTCAPALCARYPF
ncbi:MAG: hypothetical protein R3F39_05985 [Myxococcota bacterium]